MSPESSTERPRLSPAERAADLSLVLAVLVPLPALWSWGAGVGDLLALGLGGMPMAPVVALLMSAAAAAGLARRFAMADDITRHFRWAPAAIVVLGALAFVGFVQTWVGLPPAVRPWFTGYLPGSVFDRGVHGQALVYGALFGLIATLDWRVSGPPSRQRRWIRRAGGIGAALVGLGILFSNLQFGSRDRWVSLAAWWTGMEFLLLGFGWAGVVVPSGGGQPRWGGWLPWRRLQAPVGVGCLTILVMGTLGAWYARHEQGLARTVRRRELTAISELKVRQITNWWNERTMDARFFAEAAFVARDIAAVMTNRESSVVREEALHWLRLLKAGERYDRVLLFDAHRQPVLSVSEAGDSAPGELSESAAAALRTDRVHMFDLRRDGPNGAVRMEVGFSVLSEQALRSDPTGDLAAPVGYIILRLDPSRFLYPLVQSWPIPSASAEILLVRREGSEVVYLNDLRFRQKAALDLRIPIEPASLVPGVRALLGREGVIDGIDYRGEWVLAAIRVVPGTPWRLVAKVDVREVLGPLRRQAMFTFFLVAGMGGLGALGTGLFVQRREHAVDRSRLALSERLALLMRQANDIILVLDEHWRVIEANEQARLAYGYTDEELRKLTLRDLRAPETRAEFDSEAGVRDGPPSARRESVHRRKDGTTFPVEVSEQKSSIDRQVYRQVIVRDITERREKDQSLRQANRSLRTLSEAGRALVRFDDERLLLAEVCRVVVDEGGFRMAWVGFAENDGEGTVRPVASAGAVDGYLDTVRATWRESERGGGPSGLAIRTGRPCVVQDLEKDGRFSPWRDEAVKRGYRSSIALPLKAEGVVFGALRVYSDRPDAFDADEERLLTELANDLAHGLWALRVRVERDRAMESLRRREELFRCLFDSHVVGIFVADATGTIGEANETLLHLLGYQRSHLPLAWSQVAVGASGEPDAMSLAAISEAVGSTPVEREWRGRDGHPVPVLLGAARVPGPPEGLVGFVLDLRERRLADIALRASEERYRRLFEGNPHPMWVFDPETLALLAVNDAMVATYGWTRDELLRMTLLDLRVDGETPSLQEAVEEVRANRGKPQIGRHRKKDGTVFEVQTLSHTAPFAGRRSEVVLAQDVTEPRRLEREKTELQMRLQQQGRLESIGVLAAGVAHEINNPMNGLMNFAQLILDDAPPGSPIAEYAGEIMTAAGRVAEIVRNLLQFAREERRGIAPLSLHEVVRSTLALMGTVMRHDYIRIEVDLPDDLPRVPGRIQQVQQILMSLLANSRDALNSRYSGPDADKRVILRGSVVPCGESRCLRLTVEDHGTGIAPEIWDRLFDPYFTTKPADRASGLGLRIGRDLAREHGGDLHFETEFGEWTRFHLDLPLQGPAGADGRSASRRPVLVDDE